MPETKLTLAYDTETKEIKTIGISIDNLTSICLSKKDLTAALQLATAIDDDAAFYFRNNFNALFCYDNNGNTDVDPYFNDTKQVYIRVKTNFKGVSKGEMELSDAFVDIFIQNQATQAR